ncbi:hypothetical protein [Rurimicrobium arvi]|uniref:DUF2188 domain-containing protein n=1 Tax=Rurimicrobium arvi TaxID=2049916 RepID=A0ABP8N0D2_9BACT
MAWGAITITFDPTGYHQNYKRRNVDTHVELNTLIGDAVQDSVTRIRNNGYAGNIIVDRNNDQQGVPDPGPNYREI